MGKEFEGHLLFFSTGENPGQEIIINTIKNTIMPAKQSQGECPCGEISMCTKRLELFHFVWQQLWHGEGNFVSNNKTNKIRQYT